MFAYLPDFVPLIQLLVGSVFIAKYLFPVGDSSKEGKMYVSASLESVLQGENFPDYHLAESNILQDNFNLLQKEIMILLAVYGSIVLFHCSNFHCCYMPSSLGIALSSLMVTIFQLYAIFVYGKLRPSKIVFHIVTFLIIFIFVFFIIIFPNLIVFSSLYIKIINIWVFVNMLLWLLLYVKENLIRKRIPRVIYKLSINLQIFSQIGIEGRLNCIVDACRESDSKKFYLFWKAIHTLRQDSSYFLFSNDNLKFQYDATLSQKLKRIIEESDFSDICKWILLLSIKKRPRVNNTPVFSEIQNEKSIILQHGSKLLCQLGILEKNSI